MRELNTAEVLAIAGGLPQVAVLDEVSWRTPAEPVRDPMESADLAAERHPAGTPA
jgi:hypothetical protein